MTKGGYQGPEPWEIEDAVERGVRRARGEYVPTGWSPKLNPKTCCCLMPAILLAVTIIGGILAPIIFRLAGPP
ncbi:hypothetical protein [Streptomyces sp. NRRL F-5123]|uniref:hypothetical protein n=1 Tax=Streptomyces sp. NRRL F-5123 TaxID=1463856 RepID=UPI00131C08B5|nr:hypothetical protein [Streptomyces sp. NRRL F-5123]